LFRCTVIALLAAVFLQGALPVAVACAAPLAHDQDQASREARFLLKARLQTLGYSEEAATRQLDGLSADEIGALAANPRLVSRVGADNDGSVEGTSGIQLLLILVMVFCFFKLTSSHEGSQKSSPAPVQAAVPPQATYTPEPIAGNTGVYMCPFTSDDTVALWVDKGVSARFGASVGGTVGALAGQQVLKQVPFVGGILGQQAGNAIGREVAINAAGGEEYIKSTSDLSFNSVDDMAVYIYTRYSTREDYGNIVKLTGEIYPEFSNRYAAAIKRATR
jgi:hypothetical protein